jgi:hypothetical protein
MNRWSFGRQYFTSRVSGLAALLLWAGVFAAWGSSQLQNWWVGYLQSLSTTFIGIAATVWLLNFFVEIENRRIAAELLRANEQALRGSVTRLHRRLPDALPRRSAPEGSDWPQLEWLQRDIDQVCALCDRTHPGATDERLQTQLNAFRLRADDWSNSVDILGRLIRDVAPEQERAAAFNSVKTSTAQLQESAGSLVDLFGEREAVNDVERRIGERRPEPHRSLAS